ncbi:hypothetical protein BS78_03G185500, partial [Paspalum vaginatum]
HGWCSGSCRRPAGNDVQQLKHSFGAKDAAAAPRSDLWTGGLVCAFEFVRGHGLASPPDLSRSNSSRSKDLPVILDSKSPPLAKNAAGDDGSDDGDEPRPPCRHGKGPPAESHWSPIGWTRITELRCCDDITVADVAAPYWQQPAGPTWWCHVTAGHPAVDAWLATARLVTLTKSARVALLVPVRVSGGLLFELLGQSVGDPTRDEDDIPIVIRAWQAQNILITAVHVKGSAPNINVIGVTEVQELLSACGSTAPKSIHEVIAHLASRLARWDDRPMILILWRKYVFGAADEIELKFVNRQLTMPCSTFSKLDTVPKSCMGIRRRNKEDLNLLCIIFNQDMRRLATQECGSTTKSLLEAIKKDTRQMIEEQEAVRGRLFTIQDVMQSTDKSLHITHNLTVFGGCGLILSIITGLFGINVDGIPGAENTPYAFALFSGLLFTVGFLLINVGIVNFGLQKPISDQQVQVRKLELQQLVSMFQHEAETHAKVREGVLRSDLPPRAADLIYDKGDHYLNDFPREVRILYS